jgi:hypothetical protein
MTTNMIQLWLMMDKIVTVLIEYLGNLPHNNLSSIKLLQDILMTLCLEKIPLYLHMAKLALAKHIQCLVN